MEAAFLLGLILLNGLFAMSEIALVTARRGRLQRFIDEGDRGAIAAAELGADQTRFLSTIQIGITSIGILNGILGEAAFAGPFAQRLVAMGIDAQTSHYAATALVVLAITYLSIVLGELVPKRIGQMKPEAIARVVAQPIEWLAATTRPFVKALTTSTNVVLRLMGTPTTAAPQVTEEEIQALLVEGSEAGVIEQHEQTMVRNVFRLDDRQITSLMIPRADMVLLDATEPLAENLERVATFQHSRYPVVRGGLHDIAGVINSRTMLSKLLRKESIDLIADALPPVYVPESLTGMELLENFRSSGRQLALVIDEYGEVLGLVTLRDLIEAITGEFKARNVEDAWAVQRHDGSWLLDAFIPLPELKDRLGLRRVPEEDRGRYHTLSGMVMLLLGRVPQTSDSVHWEGWRFEVVDMDGKRIDKVLANRLAEESLADSP